MFFHILLLLSMFNQLTGNNLNFSYDYAVYQKTDSTYTMNIYYQIPNSSLFFLKANEQFVSRYQIAMQLLNKKEPVGGQIFTKEIIVNSYEQTYQENIKTFDSLNLNYNLNKPSESKVNAVMTVKDLNSTNIQTYQFPIELPKTASRLLFYTNQTINPQHLYYQKNIANDTLSLYMEIYESNIAYCSLWFEKKNNAPRKQKNRYSKQINTRRDYLDFNLTPTKNTAQARTFNYSLPLSILTDFGAGSYQIKITGYNSLNRRYFENIADFLLVAEPFKSDNDYYEMVDKLLYITTEQEMKKLKQIPVAERESSWKVFWKKFDPTPTTETNEKEKEYFEQIKYCVEHFSKGDRGFRSERARVYMKYGQPDYTESRPFESYNYPVEIWYYYSLARKFIFIDYRGFGEFVLHEESKI